MPQHSRIQYIKGIHAWYNTNEFGGELLTIGMLLKRQRHKDGWYSYHAHKDWTPVRERLDSAVIVISDQCFDIEEDSVEDTIVHEMIHQWQCEILDEAPHHNDTFNKKARHLSKKHELSI